MRGCLKAAAILAAAAAVLPVEALAQNSLARGGMTIAEVAAIFEAHSFSATIKGEYEIAAEAWGYEFVVDGANCSGTERCTEFLFTVGFDLPDGFPLEQINVWNARELAGRAYLDEDGDPFLDHIVSVQSGRDTGAFYEGLILWLNALEDFDAFISEIVPPGA